MIQEKMLERKETSLGDIYERKNGVWGSDRGILN